MPGQDAKDTQSISKIASEGPAELAAETANLLKWFSQCGGSDLMPQTLFKFNLVRFDRQNYVFQDKSAPDNFRGIILCSAKARDLFEVRPAIRRVLPFLWRPHNRF